MKPDKLTIHDLFQRERRYVVPLYQRAYVWNEEDQWAPLWDDIERLAEASPESAGFVSQRSHFLGAIVVNVLRIVGAGVASGQNQTDETRRHFFRIARRTRDTHRAITLSGGVRARG